MSNIIKRQRRIITLNGVKQYGSYGPKQQPTVPHPKVTLVSKRMPIITSDGRMNEVAAAAYLGRAISTLQNWRSMGQPPTFLKEHGRIFYRQTDLDDFRRS